MLFTCLAQLMPNTEIVETELSSHKCIFIYYAVNTRRFDWVRKMVASVLSSCVERDGSCSYKSYLISRSRYLCASYSIKYIFARLVCLNCIPTFTRGHVCLCHFWCKHHFDLMPCQSSELIHTLLDAISFFDFYLSEGFKPSTMKINDALTN